MKQTFVQDSAALFPGNVGHSGYQRTSHQHRMKHCFCFIIFVNYITKH
ncbi:TPA_asm: hypothetical protein GND14_002368 [Salmonella enterica subsp. houtenae serovar 50:g,z51:-]|nr:hypothetical protein [Salmonella enterica subsp. houtenae serovar 50:g,z51:-]HAE7577333.1 hypothetical protein [Salmonella enterica subsp. houtenae serovar 48:g,z51:-]